MCWDAECPLETHISVVICCPDIYDKVVDWGITSDISTVRCTGKLGVVLVAGHPDRHPSVALTGLGRGPLVTGLDCQLHTKTE